MDNRLLAKLPARELKLVQPHLQAVELRYTQVLAEPDEPITHMYFPTGGVLSMVNEPEDGDIVEFATVGNEGMVGVPLLLGALTMPSRVFVQVEGAGFRAAAKDMLEVLRQTPTFHGRLMRYVMALLNQIAQGTSCNRLHEVQEPCARWLLHTHDRSMARASCRRKSS
ncbi:MULTISPECIES: Crp/Fnr family transcriptional regulator [Bradyrhizobium]|uniref:Crp/Fnr family transcriptional regulator n=1 Tax=Bradyrhizobium vignae TaxID=1549949 RepID=A0A2U3Q743_9BRAD